MKPLHAWLAALLVFSLISSATAQIEGRVTILVDSSTQNLVKALAEKFQADTNVRVKYTPGATHALTAQISKGASADLFLGVGADLADKLKKDNKIAKAEPLLTNDLVLVVAKSAAAVKTPQDLSSDKIKKILLPDDQTAEGKAAQQALTALGLLDALSKKIIHAPDSRSVAAGVERGDAQAGVVLSTNAQSDQLNTVHTFDTHDKIVFPLMLTNRGEKNANAQKFYDFLLSSDANELYQKFGFARLEN